MPSTPQISIAWLAMIALVTVFVIGSDSIELLVEGIIGVFGLIGIWVIWRLRELEDPAIDLSPTLDLGSHGWLLSAVEQLLIDPVTGHAHGYTLVHEH